MTLAAIPAIIVAVVAAYVAARHDPQGEFDGPTGTRSLWLLLRNVFLPWFVVALALIEAVTLLILASMRRRSP